MQAQTRCFDKHMMKQDTVIYIHNGIDITITVLRKAFDSHSAPKHKCDRFVIHVSQISDQQSNTKHQSMREPNSLSFSWALNEKTMVVCKSYFFTPHPWYDQRCCMLNSLAWNPPWLLRLLYVVGIGNFRLHHPSASLYRNIPHILHHVIAIRLSTLQRPQRS